MAKLAIEPTCLDVYVSILNGNGTWEEHVFDACKSVLNPGDTFYDVGANVGYVSLEIGRALNDKVQIFAFEPQPALSRAIAISSKLCELENLYVYETMVGAKGGDAALYIGSHSIHASEVPREDGSTCIKRPIISIDDFVGHGIGAPPSVLKIDIEGGELAAVQGASKTIAMHRPFIVFESDSNMNRFSYTRRQLLDLIRSIGKYEFFFIDPKNKGLTLITEANCDDNISDIMAKPH